MSRLRSRWSRPAIVIAILVAIGVVAASGAYALNAGDEGGVSTSSIKAPAENGVPVGLPPNAESLVDVASLQFVGTGPGGFRVWRGDGTAAAEGLLCYVTAGTSDGIPLSGVDCDPAESYEKRGITVSGGTSPEGHFVGYAVLGEGLTSVEIDGKALSSGRGIAFIDAQPGAAKLQASGAGRAVQADISRFARPLR